MPSFLGVITKNVENKDNHEIMVYLYFYMSLAFDGQGGERLVP